MNQPLFLDLDDILQIHTDTIAKEGGSAGVRDITLIASAVAAPRASFDGEYLHPSLYHMAAALMYALIQNHGFIDGNKRIGTLAALVFLEVNNRSSYPPATELENIAMAVATSQINREELALFWTTWTSIED